jgi:hypothetical protein
MGGSAGQDKGTKSHKDPVKCQVSPFAREKKQKNWYDVVASRDECVRDYVKPKNSRAPEVARAVRHEIASEQLSEELKHDSLGFFHQRMKVVPAA